MTPSRIANVGFAQAFLVLWGMAPGIAESLKLTFGQWLSVWNASYGYSNAETEVIALRKMEELAETFEQWMDIFYSTTNSVLEKKSLDKMEELAKTYAHWSDIFMLSPKDSSLEGRASLKMERLSGC